MVQDNLIVVKKYFHPEDGGTMSLRNDGIPPHHYIASQSRRIRLEFSSPRKPQVPKKKRLDVLKPKFHHHFHLSPTRDPSRKPYEPSSQCSLVLFL